MKYYGIMGRITAFTAAKLKNVGFANIEGFVLHDNFVQIITKPDEQGRREQYSISLTYDGDWIGDLPKNLITK